MSTQSNKQFERDFFAAVWNGGNLGRIGEFIGSDFVSSDPFAGEVRGVEGVRQIVSVYRSAFPDLLLTIEDMIADGDRVVTRWRAEGTHRGELMGISPTNKQTTVSGISIDRISDGKIRESWSNWDALGLMRQLGVVPDLEEMAR